MSITIHPINALKDNYIWSIETNSSRNAIIVDPGDAKPVLDYLHTHSLNLIAILITHHHWDHTNGIDEIIKQTPAPVYGPSNETIPHLTHPMKHHDSISLNHLPISFTVLEIPGHTHGHIAYYGNGMLFCGDTLFSAGCGRVFEGTYEQMYESLMRLRALPNETRVYCAHEYTLANLRFAEAVEPNNPFIQEKIKLVSELREINMPSLPSTIGEEKLINPFLRCDLSEVKRKACEHAARELNNPAEVYAELREWKNQFR